MTPLSRAYNKSYCKYLFDCQNPEDIEKEFTFDQLEVLRFIL